MEKIAAKCQTCLTTDRRLISTYKIMSVLKEIKIKQFKMIKRICWECHTVIVKFYKFLKQVSRAQSEFSKKDSSQKTYSNLLKTTKNFYDFEFTYKEVKVTSKVIKNEDYTEYHNDNEIFVDNIRSLTIKDDLKEKPLSIKDTSLTIKDNLKDTSFTIKDDLKEKSLFQKDKSLTIKDKYLTIKDTPLSIKDISLFIKDTSLNIKEKSLTTKDDLKDKFKIIILEEEEMLRRREEKRNQPNYKKIPFKCEMCVLGFIKKEYYDCHLKKKHDASIGRHKCPVCATHFPSISSLNKHKNKHYQYYKCILCEYKTWSVKPVLNHIRIKHNNDERGRICCKQCEIIVRSPEELKEHTQKVHTLYCNECGEQFKGKNTLRTHIIKIHAIKREFICDVCNKTFLTKSRLESHMIKHSQTLAKQLAYCKKCCKQYKDIHVYRNHIRNNINHAKDRYTCTVCKKIFASKVYYKKHYNFYHLKKSRYKCESCDKIFISEWRKKNHNQKYHGLSRTRDHDCNICHKKFYTSSTLRAHALTHSDKRQFMCSQCGDTFKQRPALYTHIKLVHKSVLC